MADDGPSGPSADEPKKIIHTYPLVRNTDMTEEMKMETIEITVTACEKFSANNEAAARMIKEQMDIKFGPAFLCVVGEGFSFEITYEIHHLMYLFFGGNLAILIWKC